jgi:hypothetical protein
LATEFWGNSILVQQLWSARDASHRRHVEGSVMTMSALLIDGAMIGTTLLAGRSIAGSWKQFRQLFAQLREEMAATDPIRTISAITLSTSADPAPAMVYRPEFGVVSNQTATLGGGIKPRSLRRPAAAMRAAA